MRGLDSSQNRDIFCQIDYPSFRIQEVHIWAFFADDNTGLAQTFQNRLALGESKIEMKIALESSVIRFPDAKRNRQPAYRKVEVAVFALAGYLAPQEADIEITNLVPAPSEHRQRIATKVPRSDP